MKEGVVWFMPFEEALIVWLQQLGAGTLLRTAVGGVLYLVLSSLIKLATGGIFPAGTQGFLLMRSVRYGLTVILLVGVYPYAFRLAKRLFGKGKAA